MSRKQGPHYMGMRPAAIAAGRQQKLPMILDTGSEVAA